MMSSYGQIFISIAITGIICLIVYMIAMAPRAKGFWIAAWLVSLVVFVSTIGVGVVSFGSLMKKDTIATMNQMHDEVSAQYDLSGLQQFGSIYDDATQGNRYVKDLTGTDILGSIF